ncbi:MAG TPA: nuclear transport factor 2 family protein, partial [Clostridia bacterium]|nr:nuclear transport factor 2 family protein [Clostridia bacterium]
MMATMTPEDLHSLFVQHFNAGGLEALVELYEPSAILVPEPGFSATGHATIREALRRFLGLKGNMQMQVRTVLRSVDVALLLSDWTVIGKAPDGAEVRLQGQTTDVVRRQPDGRWLIAIGNPFGTKAVTDGEGKGT